MHSYRKKTCSEECSELAFSSPVLHVYKTLSANRHAYTMLHFSIHELYMKFHHRLLLHFVLLHKSKIREEN